MKIGLRGRLVLWYLLTIPALIFGLVFIAQQVLVISLREQLDNDLWERAQLTANAISSAVRDNPENYPEIIEQLNEEHFPYIPRVLRVSDESGRILATFGAIPDPAVARLDALLSTANTEEGEYHSISVMGEKALRVYTVALETTSPTVPLVVIQTGDSFAHISAVESRFWQYGMGVGSVGTVVVLAVGFFILQRGFRPLNRILERVQEIGHGNLGDGLPQEPRPPELQQLADSLNSMWHRLDRAFSARESFFASVSHDLRTPLTAIQGHVDVLLMKQPLDRETQDSLERIAREVRRLVRMTDDLLLNAQLESNSQLHRQPVNLRQLLEEVVADIWMLSEDLELNLPAEEDVLVAGDQDLLKQAVLNIVDNAVKYTPRGRGIKLSLGRSGGWAVLEVADAGVGIPPEDLPHIREPFYRSGASRHTEARGAGLGLAIVDRVVKLHEGWLDIESTLGVGTTVKVMLPSLDQAGGSTEAPNPLAVATHQPQAA